jgi:glycine/D-amino acid oxidase-like deaminating enzyme
MSHPAEHFDVAIVGGAAIGSAVAYFLKAVERFSGTVAVIERDPTFRKASTTLSAAGIRQQFSTAESIRLSRFGLEFLKSLRIRHGPDADPGFVEGGYLILAPQTGLSALRENHRLQLREAAPVALLDRDQLTARFPWLSNDGIGAGSLGLSGEGWFDAHTVLKTLSASARQAGTTCITGEVAAVHTAGDRVKGVITDGRRIACDVLVNAAGPAGGRIAALAGRALPVEPRKRTVFVVIARTRRAGCRSSPIVRRVIRRKASFITANSRPIEDRAADPDDFEPDHDIFEEKTLPALAARIRFRSASSEGSLGGPLRLHCSRPERRYRP